MRISDWSSDVCSSDLESLRASHASRESNSRQHDIAGARAARHRIDWAAVTPPRPSFLGLRAFDDYPLGELVDRIDWTPFFRTWELKGNYPAILESAEVGEEIGRAHV